MFSSFVFNVLRQKLHLIDKKSSVFFVSFNTVKFYIHTFSSSSYTFNSSSSSFSVSTSLEEISLNFTRLLKVSDIFPSFSHLTSITISLTPSTTPLMIPVYCFKPYTNTIKPSLSIPATSNLYYPLSYQPYIPVSHTHTRTLPHYPLSSYPLQPPPPPPSSQSPK